MQNDFGLISIIMAAYNAEKTIEQAINSVLSQTYPDFELLVVNDCSTDKTAMLAEAIVKKDDRVRLISNEKNSGVSYTRKHGLEEASGEWVAILDSDDAWAPEKLEKQINLQKKTNADLLFTGSAFMDADGKPIDWYLAAPAEVTYRQLLKQNVLSNSSALVRKELYAKYYAVGDGMHEDFALWLNILKDGRKAYGVDEPLLIYRIAKSSKSGNKFKAAKMNWNTYRYIGLNPIEAAYYEGWYMIKNVIKYTNLKISGRGGVWNEVIYIASFDILIVPEQLHEEQLEAA
ncbi:glycosyltransferase family 2 protein [Faecalibacterium prausnitzii]|nr:glycosyltransferase family 2 protein [Faecalibacterium prausnitzii]